jgi:hypothetical protein
MPIELCVLASGSGGNCTVLRTPGAGGVVLIDAGMAPQTTAVRLNGTGVRLADVSAICLTHLDGDHFSFYWVNTILKYGIRVFCHESQREQLLGRLSERASATADVNSLGSLIIGFDETPFEPLPGLTFRPIPLAHDREGSHGFLADGYDTLIGYATDLGHVPARLLDLFCGLDVLCIESNYDPQMQQDSPRPWFLKQRIMGGQGHLSNEQAFDAVRLILDRCEKRGLRLPEHIVLLHRSRQCNCPNLLRRLFSRDARLGPRLTLAEQFLRSEWIRPRSGIPLPGEQLQLAWG